MKCVDCGRSIPPLEEFPGPRCLDCWAVTPEGSRMPTSDELVAMWGGPVHRKG